VERIFDKVEVFTARPKNGLSGINQRKNPGKPARNGPKTAYFAGVWPIVTLWQQLGENIPFTSKLTLRNACF
jgi:hypothetical protein